MFPVLELQITDKRYKNTVSPWLYSNQVKHLNDELLNSERIAFIKIKDSKKIGVYCKSNLISVHFLSDKIFSYIEKESISDENLTLFIQSHLQSLFEQKSHFEFSHKEAYRLSHGDFDSLPNIAIDDYHCVRVIQSSSAIGDFLLPYVVEAFKKIDTIPLFERSTGQVRKFENLPERTRWLVVPKELETNYSIKTFFADLTLDFFLNKAQKTGLFLDQRQNLKYLSSILENLKLNSCLDICCYVGAWSSVSAKAGIKNFTLIDQDSFALGLAKKNILNNYRMSHLQSSEELSQSEVAIDVLHGDMFEHLSKLIKEEKKFDLVVADPPAFAKSKKHLAEAKRAYSRMTKLASRLTSSNGILIVCSCSRNVEEKDFLESLGIGLAGEEWIILHRGEQSPCHTRVLSEDSSEYLKCYFLQRKH